MIVVKRLLLALMGATGLVALLIAAFLLLLAGGCIHLDLSQGHEKSIPPEQAVQKIDAELKNTAIPSSFVGIKASEGYTAMEGSVSITVAFKAARKDVDEFLAHTHAQLGSSWYRPARGCGTPPPLPIAQYGLTFYDASQFGEWYEAGVFAHCATIEHWSIPAAEWRSGSLSGAVYREIGTDTKSPDTSINIVLTFFP